MTDVYPKSVSTPAEVDAEEVPAISPQSYLTLSASPDFQPVHSGALWVERLDRIMRAERDPLTPELLREKLHGRPSGLRARLEEARRMRDDLTPMSEAELRELWGK